MANLVKSVNGLAIASVKTVKGLARGSVKTIYGLDNTGGSTPSIDASSPAIVSSPGFFPSIATAAFDPPANSVFLAFAFFEGLTGNASPVVTLTDNVALDTEWTLIQKRDRSNGTVDPSVWVFWAAKTASTTGMIVTMTPTLTGHAFDERGAIKVYVLTGCAASPIGNSGNGDDANNNATPTIYTSSQDLSLGFGGGACTINTATPPTSSDIEAAFTQEFTISGLSAYKSAGTTPSGTAVTINFDADGAGAATWAWVGAELKGA